MVPSLLCTVVAHISYFSMFSVYLTLFLPLSFSLPIYVFLWLQDTCHIMPFTKQHSAYAWVVTCILFLISLTFHNLSLHSSYKIHQPFTNYFLRLPYPELLEKRLFRSRANRRLVILLWAFVWPVPWMHSAFSKCQASIKIFQVPHPVRNVLQAKRHFRVPETSRTVCVKLAP